MLSERILERVSAAYRGGYLDGYYGRDRRETESGLLNPFADHDYDYGYKAGGNDARWAASHPTAR